MFELLTLIVFLWLMFKVLGLTLKLTWGAAKIFASLLMVVAFPLLVVCFVFIGGIALFIPIALIGLAFGVVKAVS